MMTQQTQIKINLPVDLRDFLYTKSQKYGMPMAGYIKHLILKDVADLDYPIFKISKRSENKAKKALGERKKATKVKDVSAFFRSL